MRCEDATPAAPVSAANAVLDRGWGKATQPLESSGDGALELIHRIERVIVHPERLDKEGFSPMTQPARYERTQASLASVLLHKIG